MPTVTLNIERQSNKDIDRALRQLRNLEDDCGTLKALREKEFYEKPTAKRKRKKAAAVMRANREKMKGLLVSKPY